MGYIEKTLSVDEKIIITIKIHPLYFMFSTIFYATALLPFFGPFWNLYYTEMALTSKRVICKTGIISRKTNEMLLNKIETVEMKQSILGRILGYCDLRITGTGMSDVFFNNISNPYDVKKSIENQLS